MSMSKAPVATSITMDIYKQCQHTQTLDDILPARFLHPSSSGQTRVTRLGASHGPKGAKTMEDDARANHSACRNLRLQVRFTKSHDGNVTVSNS